MWKCDFNKISIIQTILFLLVNVIKLVYNKFFHNRKLGYIIKIKKKKEKIGTMAFMIKIVANNIYNSALLLIRSLIQRCSFSFSLLIARLVIT